MKGKAETLASKTDNVALDQCCTILYVSSMMKTSQ